MTQPLPPEWGGTSPDAAADGQSLAGATPPSDDPPRSPFAFALNMIGVYGLVLALIGWAKIRPDHALEIAAGATGIGVAGCHTRGALVTLGRRLINGSGTTGA
jgi:hypothetical protein